MGWVQIRCTLGMEDFGVNKVILYIATSLDGFIADVEGGVDWLPHEPDPDDSVGFKALLNRISIIVMGRKSYEQILGFGDWAWNDKQTYVFTSKNLKSENSNISFVQGSPQDFLKNLKQQGDIWLLGGAKLVSSFAKEKLIDECIVTIVPQTLGEGIKLELPYNDFDLLLKKSCGSGMIQKVYLRKKL